MSCQNCDGKKLLKIMRGTYGREIYITVKGLDWDFTNPPSGYTYSFAVEVIKPDETSVSLTATAVNENTVKFTLDAKDSSDDFYDTGLYGLKVRCTKQDSTPTTVEQHTIEVDTCIYIYNEVNCAPPC